MTFRERDADRECDLLLGRAQPGMPRQDTKKSPSASITEGDFYGADSQIRTGDLILTNSQIRTAFSSNSARLHRICATEHDNSWISDPHGAHSAGKRNEQQVLSTEQN